MNLSSLAGMFGAAAGGYADDEKAALLRAQMARAAQGQDDDRITKLREAGYVPLSNADLMSSPALPHLPAPSVMPPNGGARVSGGPPVGGGIDAVLDAAKAKNPPLTVRTQAGPQNFRFDYDASPTGIAQKKALEVLDQKEQQDQSRQSALAKEKATAAAQAVTDKNTERARIVAERMTTLAKLYPHMTPEQLKGIAGEDAAFAAAVHPDKETPHFQLIKDDASGRWSRVRVDGPEGPLAESFSRAGAAGSGGMAQAIQARMLAAVSEARGADDRMKKYEEKLISGDADPGVLTRMGGTLAMNLSGTHSPVGAALQSGAEETTDPAYLQYRRDAALIARAEQLMSSRGGSESAVMANQLLARAGGNKDGLKESIHAAQNSRAAIFGPHGGIAQALTPEQLAKLDAGIAAMKKGDADFNYADVGKMLNAGDGAAAPTPTPATTEQGPTLTQARALWDAAVAKHGRAKVQATYGGRP